MDLGSAVRDETNEHNEAMNVDDDDDDDVEARAEQQHARRILAAREKAQKAGVNTIAFGEIQVEGEVFSRSYFFLCIFLLFFSFSFSLSLSYARTVSSIA